MSKSMQMVANKLCGRTWMMQAWTQCHPALSFINSKFSTVFLPCQKIKGTQSFSDVKAVLFLLFLCSMKLPIWDSSCPEMSASLLSEYSTFGTTSKQVKSIYTLKINWQNIHFEFCLHHDLSNRFSTIQINCIVSWNICTCFEHLVWLHVNISMTYVLR